MDVEAARIFIVNKYCMCVCTEFLSFQFFIGIIILIIATIIDFVITIVIFSIIIIIIVVFSHC